MNLEPVIGLEIHVQLKTASKMFCSCSAHEINTQPNTNVCPVCLAQPGVLPIPNSKAIHFAVLTALALNGKISTVSKFDRKNYFYPDLPKGYQISQFDMPVSTGGYLDIEIPNGARKCARIRLNRLHLEEDAAKSMHIPGEGTLVDFNRAGVPLVEIVTEPDFKTPQETKIFLQELRLIARYLQISDADMEKGHLRVDANISLREFDENGNLVGSEFNPKTEIKNINSFKAVERALEHEIQRQTKLWKAGNPPTIQSTRGWNDATQTTVLQRTKEEAQDYRYFPEPDIPPMRLDELERELRDKIPELPFARRERFVNEYELLPSNARQMCEDLALSDYVERVFSELYEWVNSLPDEEAETMQKNRLGKLVAGWMLTKLQGLMSESSVDIRTIKITPENFAEFITLVATGKVSSKNGLAVLMRMMEDGSDPTHVIEEMRIGKIDDDNIIASAVDTVIRNNPNEVARYRAGKKELLQFFIGMVLKETEGNADAGMVKNFLLTKLEEAGENE